MVAHALDDSHGAGIAHGEPLARHALEIGLASDGAVEDRVADDDVLGGLALGLLGLAHNHPPAGKALADIVVGVADQVEGHAVSEEGAEALARNAGETNGDGLVRQAYVAVLARDLA